MIQKTNTCRRTQSLEPFLSVASGKILSDKFRESFVLELFWKNKIEFEISDEFKNDSDKKIQFFSLIKKYFSKKIRKLLSR